MAALMEQVAHTSDWPASSTHYLHPHAHAPRGGSGALAAFIDDTALHNGRTSVLARVVQAEILPRLALSSRAVDEGCRGVAARAAPTEQDTATLSQLVLNGEAREAVAFVERLRLRGATAESLYLGVLTDAARRLDGFWQADRCSFVDVTIGMGRLQQVVHALSPSFMMASVVRAHADTVLLLPAPGEQHTFGMVMLAEFFRRAGWHVSGGPMSTRHDPVEIVRRAWVDVVGFSIGSEVCLDRLARCIRDVRRASRNRDLGVMVGGALFRSRPELAARVGADATAADAPSAVQQASRLLAVCAAAS